MHSLKALFEPEKVLLIGSSLIQERVGLTSPQLFENVVYNMQKFFKGETYVLDVEGNIGFKNLKELPETPELAVVMLPAESSLSHIWECAEYGVKAFVIITGNFREENRRQLLEIVERFKVRVLGPNTVMGVINTTNGLNTTFERDLMPKKGEIAFIAQSGGVGACILDWICYYNIGISKFLFTGDKLDVDEADLLHYLGQDRETKVICLYMEGVKNGRKFIEEAWKISRKKPVLALKGGITQESTFRVMSHTASMAGSDEVFNAALKKANIIRVENIENLINAALALAKQPPMLGDKVAIVSNVGGPAILAADALAKNNLKLAQLSEATVKKIEKLYPGVEAVNPIDIIADAKAQRYSKVLNLVLSDENVDGVLVINMLKSCFFKPEDSKAIIETTAKYQDKPVVDVAPGAEDFRLVYEVLDNSKIPVYNMPEKGVKALKILRDYGKIIKKNF
ncbi:MAG: CoA-binding protein [Candidatus Bathyarchaeia archaeon]